MKNWTIMAYLAGDNNLSEDMISSLRGMQRIMQSEGSDDEINLIAIYDSGYPTVAITAYKFTHENSSKRLQDCVFERHLSRSQRERENKTDTAFIKDFVEIVASDDDFLAENYALIMSGHSDAVLGKTMFRDDNPDTHLHLSFLANILHTSAGFLKNRDKFAVVCFDSCMMGMLEVGCELADSTEILVASQGFAPTAGWDYEEILKDLVTQKGNMNPLDFAASIAKHQINSSQNYAVGGRSMNLSVADLLEAGNLAKSVNSLAEIFNDILFAPIDKSIPKEQAEANAVIAEFVKNLLHDSHYYSQTFLHEQAVDILDFVNSLASNCDLKRKEIELLVGETPKSETAALFNKKLELIQTQCTDVKAKVGKYVKANHASGAEYQFSEGVSVFFPWTMLALNIVFGRYKSLEFSKNKAKMWLKFIEKYTKMTFRSNGEPRFENNLNYLEWRGSIADLHRASTARDTGPMRANTAKANTAKAETDLFYKFFGRFRNHPIYHDFVK